MNGNEIKPQANIPAGYSCQDVARFNPEYHESSRTDFERDRARLIHSSGWRRLAAKTQVLSPTAGVDFARNRLTHSLEVAQIGRELAISFGVSADLVDTACMAHDLGHPPFGHNGEVALNEWIANWGGFEGNAQTLRLLVRLEPKHFSASGKPLGLNLTRATLDASCKYPWPQLDDSGRPRRKFGYYADDKEIFDWVRIGAKENKKCFEAQVMDLADDIAYSVHDFEDAIVSEYLDPMMLTSRSGHDSLLTSIADWADSAFSKDEIAEAFDSIASTPNWLTDWQANRADMARLKNFTSEMIGRFARDAIALTKANSQTTAYARYGADVHVSRAVRAQIAVLKGIVANYVMTSGRRKPTYRRQRDLLTELLETLWADPQELEPAFYADFLAADSEAAARRVIVDQVACLTDQAAIKWYERLCQVPLV